jgi:hypothetical protein
MSQNWSMERLMDLLVISGAGGAGFIVGAALGWLIARWRFAARIGDLNSKLVLQHRVNKQLSETIQAAAAAEPSFEPTPHLTIPAQVEHESVEREPMVLSG